jgi:hypothetical protein
MKIRYIAAAGILATGMGVGFAGGAIANASGTTLQTVSKTETIVSAKCYAVNQMTVTYYHYSSKTGWTRYPAPKRTHTTSETCHK